LIIYLKLAQKISGPGEFCATKLKALGRN